MFGIKQSKKQKIIDEKVGQIQKLPEQEKLVKNFNANRCLIEKLFADNDTLIARYVENGQDASLHFCLFYSDGVVNSGMINESIIKPLMLCTIDKNKSLIEALSNRYIMISETKITDSVRDIIQAISYGDTVLLAQDNDQAIVLNTKGFLMRAVTEPENEKVLSGPKEGFTDMLLPNLSLIRRKVRSNALKMKYITFGERTCTNACVCYLEGIVKPEILQEFYRRIEKIDIDAILDTNYITELIKDSPRSPFRTTGYTERPDVVIAKLLEGRIALFLDGTPVVMTVPYLFIENFQSNEDYYLNYYYTAFSRLLRIFAFFLTIFVPAMYIAVVAYHPEMMPTPMLVNIAAERQSVPLPAALEAFILLLTFDILRETGVRMPTNIGQALSIVGALVIGQAAVEAKLVAAPMIIVVGLTGITNLLVPKLNAPVILCRYSVLICAASFGFLGLLLGFSVMLIHILNLRSFGISHLTNLTSLKLQEMKDTVLRFPWWFMITRPGSMAQDKVRMKNKSV